MRITRRRPVAFILAGLFWLAPANAAPDFARMLAGAERMHATDEAKARQMLDAVKRSLTPASDPGVLAQVDWLECSWSDDPAARHRFVETGLPLAERARSTVLRAKLTLCHARTLQFEGKSQQATADYAASAALAAQAGDDAVQADALKDLGNLQYEHGAMADALTNLQAAYRIQERLGNDAQRRDVLTSIANVYADSQVAQYDRAIEYYRQLLGEYEKHGKPNDVADTLFNIGSTFETKGNFIAAEQHYRRALEIFQKAKRGEDIAYTQRAIGSALMKQGRAAEGLPFFDAALAFFEKEKDVSNVAFVRQFRGQAFRRLGRAQPALADLAAARRFYESENNARFLEKNAEETALVYEQLGDWRNANEFRKRLAAYQQQLAAARRDELASRLRVEFDSEKKEQDNRALARENALRAEALRAAHQNQRLQLAVIALTALLAVALAILFWRQVAHARRMRAMAMTDELTRLPNRRHILAAAEIAFAEAKRNARPAALITFDIDRFKRINDTYGHAAGDEVLKGVARVCRMNLRPSDQVGRIGGEEFLVVLQPGTGARQAFEVAERLRAAVEAMDLSSIASWGAAGLQVTISLGVWAASEYDAHAAIAAADALLYRAKESGRNRVEMTAARMTPP